MKDIVEMLAATATVIIGLATLYIGVRLYWNDRLKIKQDLFDRRYAVFNELMTLMVLITQAGKVDEDLFRKYLEAMNVAPFLFGEEIITYTDHVRDMVIALQTAQGQLANNGLANNPVERKKLIQSKADTLKWLHKQNKEAYDKFAKYLSLIK